MKKLLVVVISVVMMISLFGCGGKKESVEYTKENPLTLKMAYVISTEDTGHKAFEKFKAAIEKESEGRVKVELYPNGELGSDTAVLESVLLGDIQIASVGLSSLTAYDPKVTIAELPYLFDDYETMDAAINGEVGKMMDEWFDAVGFKSLGLSYDGTRQISNNVRPITKLADLKGIKLRAMDSPSHILTLKSLGANPIPMPYGDIYTGLQQGTIDGQDNGPALTYTSKFHEVQKYYSITNTIMANSPIVMSKAVFEGYPEDIQNMIVKYMKEFGMDWQRPIQRSEELEYVKKINADGCIVNEIADLSEFKEATKAVYEQAKKDYGEEFYNEFLKAAGYN